MTYQRIFWLDDSPNFFDRMENVALEAALPLDLSGLLRRTTFTFDLEMAVDVVSREQFDLYILDADFPNRMPDERRASLDAYLVKVCAGVVDHWKEYPSDGDHQGNVNNNGFIFYEQQRSHFAPEAKVLVHSMSDAAPVLAYLLDLPMYSKNTNLEGVRQELLGGFDRCEYPRWLRDRFVQKVGGDIAQWYVNDCPAPDLQNYELGARKELIERYLL
ncbi:hypothetical protein HZC31_00195 [Candidatus Woesearchaeota archaeon]|nr:hypothetical protein [Candidatus Woesearchaeota archaeon]